MRPFDSPRQQAAKGAAKALWAGQRLAATSWGAAEAGTICVTDSTTCPPWAWRVVGPLGAPLDHMQGKHGSARPHAHTPTHTHLPASSCVPPPAVTPKVPLFRRIPIFLPSLRHCRLRLIPTVPAFTPLAERAPSGTLDVIFDKKVSLPTVLWGFAGLRRRHGL